MKNIVLVICLVVLILGITGCKKEEVTNIPINDVADLPVNLDGISPEIKPVAKVEDENIVDFKSKYEEKLNVLQIKDMYSEYALYDIDEDNIPEMIVKSGMSEADTQITIYDIINNNLNETVIEGFGGHTNIVGAIDINTIILQYGQMDYEKVAVLHYNQDGSYTTEIIKEEVVDPEIGYIPFEALKMYQFEDKEGLNWKQNPDDENYWYINAGNEES